ncbi:YcgL domain-containing protein [Marinomonas agarivorans]|nr:YcgL domain-containing protein [Marinomonas agarivorans]
MSLEQRLVQVFKSSKKDEMYLYVAKEAGLAEVPEELMSRFGEGISVMLLMLNKEKQLARTTGEKVLTAIEEQGFYLQLPPAKDDSMLDLYKTPTEAIY